MAVNDFFGRGSEVIYCRTFRDLIKSAEDTEESLGGMMAIENTIAGSILPNYNLLSNSSLFIIGETNLKIGQQLLVNHGVSLDEIEEVQSHPMALQQCSAFLEKYNWRLVESVDTGLSAKEIAQSKTRKTAAIASSLAAELFDLDVAAYNVHTLEHNYTRFLALSVKEDYPDDANKASVYFETDHKTGSLANVLNVISEIGINLSKLQSIPIPGSNWRYGFYADMDFDDRWQLERAVILLKKLTNTLRVQGIYKKGLYYDNGKAAK